MSDHKVRIGQIVQLSRSRSRNIRGGSCEVTKRLPDVGGEFEYRIKSTAERHERVARELVEVREPHARDARCRNYGPGRTIGLRFSTTTVSAMSSQCIPHCGGIQLLYRGRI
jgi:hypothetical protein